MKNKPIQKVYLFSFIMFFSIDISAQFLMYTHGYVAFAPYVSGQIKDEEYWPGYRAEFLTNIDIYKFGRSTLYGTIGNTTMISISETSVFTLNKYRYNLSANLRYEFDKFLIKCSYYRGSISKVGAVEEGTPVWWNSLQLGLGTPGAYYLYLRNIYKKRENAFINRWDAQITAGFFKEPAGTVSTGMNHHYQYELFSLFRYHLGVYKKWAAFIGFNQNLWILKNSSTEHKLSITFNLFRKGSVNFAGLYYTYFISDTFTPDNENNMGAVGLRIIF